MYRLILLAAFILVVHSCSNKKDNAVIHYPSEQYEYIAVDTSKATFRNIIYVPVYSHIYILNGTHPLYLAATLSTRNTGFSDSIFITKIDYYNSQGQLIKKYLDKSLLLKPMHSAEFIVEESNTEGGAGAYFIINTACGKPGNPLLVQAIMASQANSLGIAFKTEGILLNQNGH